MGDKKFSGRSALEALFGAIKSSLSSKQNQTLSTTIAGSSTVEGALQALEQSYSGLDYSELDNKPQINGVELSGNKTASDLGITIPTNLSDLNDDSTHRTVSDTEKSTWDGKQNALTFDNVPTQNSNNPVKSDGIFSAIDDSVSLKTAMGNPITLTDAANANLEELLMTIEPVQSGSGDPSPTNVRPISGLTEGKVFDYGENLVDITKLTSIKDERGISFTLNGDGTVTANGTATGRCQIYWVIPNNSATQFGGKSLSGNLSIDNCSLILELDGSLYTEYARDNGEGSVISNDIASAPESQGVCLIWRIMPGVTLDNVTITPRISDAATATITFGQTVYGGSVNFKTGEVIVTHAVVDMGTLTYNTGSGLFYVMMDSIGAKQSEDSIRDLKSSIYINGGMRSAGQLTDYMIASNTSRYFYIKDPRTNNISELITLVTGQTLCYELETPVTLTLTPAELELLKGNNTITANGAEISLSYYPDNAIGALAGRVDDIQAQIQVIIKRKYITGTTSANGNLILNDFNKSNTVVVGCQMVVTDEQGGDMVVAVPYTYSGLLGGKWGLHCTSSMASGGAIVTKDVVGYVYYVEMPAFN